VYLRLLELKKQFSHFEENFTVPDTENLTIHCLHPVLKSDDMHWLGAEPQTVTPTEDGEEWSVRWIKESAPDIKEDHVYDMEIDMRFVDAQLVEIRIPHRYLAYVSKDLLVNMLRSTGTAKINRDEHNADAHTETPASVALPDFSSIHGMMGEPTRKQSAPGQTIYFYRYRLDMEQTKIKPVEIVFAFDANSGELRKFTAKLPRGTLNYSFKPTAPEASKNTK
jgi:hypothetical protein